MNTSVVTALSALAGAAIGSVSTVIASWLAQYAQARTQRRVQNQVLRQELYRQFVEESSKLYLHALQNDHADVAALMGLYAELSRMRILSSAAVVDSADQLLRKIVNTYLEPNKTFPELQKMADSGLIDPLRNFSEACREEFRLRNSPTSPHVPFFGVKQTRPNASSDGVFMSARPSPTLLVLGARDARNDGGNVRLVFA
jgi:hypothetical protein